MIQKLSQRFDQLESELMQLEAGKVTTQGHYGIQEHVDKEQFSQWLVSAKSLLVNTCGESSEHLKAFNAAEKPTRFDTNYKQLCRVRPVFLAAKNDFQGGYLASIKHLVQAEIFESELEQAVELLNAGYKGPGAVVAGVVLETALRDLCSQNSIPHGKLDKMNADLAKAGVYNKLQQKKITALADIRNDAAHGHWQNFSEAEAMNMVRDVESFLATYLA